MKVATLVFEIRVKKLQRALIGPIIFLTANHEAQRHAPVQPFSLAADVEEEPPQRHVATETDPVVFHRREIFLLRFELKADRKPARMFFEKTFRVFQSPLLISNLLMMLCFHW